VTTGVRVKICGITRLQDALAACDAGADALGFNFWPGSKRHVSAAVAAGIVRALPPFVTVVGVFVDQPREELARIAGEVGLHVLQLHGDEAPEDCAGHGLPVIKALRADASLSAGRIAAYPVRAVLLDTPAPAFGGTGVPFDWTAVASLTVPVPVILAGGLTPDNVGEAVRVARPWAVDVASGVESAPGVKDTLAMRRFVRAARAAADADSRQGGSAP
jgi:phosphoribosylanthranilate isomerase